MLVLQTLDAAIRRWLLSHSIQLPAQVLGLVCLTFGVLKYVPAEELTVKTTDALTFGLLPGDIRSRSSQASSAPSSCCSSPGAGCASRSTCSQASSSASSRRSRCSPAG
jgi:hypothetical protein